MAVTLLDVLSRLSSVRRTGPNQWFALCPLHTERTGSLSIRVAPGHPPYALHCFGCGAGTRDVLAAFGLDMGPAPYVAPPVDIWDEAHREALAIADRHGWRDPDLIELRHWRERARDWSAAAERLGPDDPASWEMLAAAAEIDAIVRLIETAA